ncbi:MAG: 3D domain-containing protein [Bacillota bacterium]|nr:3D domain-containing protein [Bacillota bacterium]
MNKKIVMIAVLAVLVITSCMIGIRAVSTDKAIDPSQIAQSETDPEVNEMDAPKEAEKTPEAVDENAVVINEAPDQKAKTDASKDYVKQVENEPSPAPQVEQTENPAPIETPPTVSRGEARTITVVATGYTDAPEENYPWAGAPSYIGLPLERGIVAVDPNIIPMGTKLYIEGYGEGIAADQGGAIKGNRIDLFFDTKTEAFDWGMRTVEVTILP